MQTPTNLAEPTIIIRTNWEMATQPVKHFRRCCIRDCLSTITNGPAIHLPQGEQPLMEVYATDGQKVWLQRGFQGAMDAFAKVWYRPLETFFGDQSPSWQYSRCKTKVAPIDICNPSMIKILARKNVNLSTNHEQSARNELSFLCCMWLLLHFHPNLRISTWMTLIWSSATANEMSLEMTTWDTATTSQQLFASLADN